MIDIQLLESAYDAQSESAAILAVKALFLRGRAMGFRVHHADDSEGKRILASARLLLSLVTEQFPSIDELASLSRGSRLYKDACLISENLAPHVST